MSENSDEWFYCKQFSCQHKKLAEFYRQASEFMIEEISKHLQKVYPIFLLCKKKEITISIFTITTPTYLGVANAVTNFNRIQKIFNIFCLFFFLFLFFKKKKSFVAVMEFPSRKQAWQKFPKNKKISKLKFFSKVSDDKKMKTFTR